MKTPSPEVLFEALQPLMVAVWDASNNPELFRWANERMLGDEGKVASDFSEPTGLHNYGDAHLSDPTWDAPKQIAEELVDAVNICILTRHRAQVHGEALSRGLEFVLGEVERACIKALKLLVVADKKITCSEE